MKNLTSIEEIKKAKEHVAFWNEMNAESEGRIIYIEKERRFRYKKYIDGKLVSVTSRNSIKDVIDKMNCKEKELDEVKRGLHHVTVEKSISDFYYKEYSNGFAGMGKKRVQRKQTTLLRTYVVIKNQIIKTTIGCMDIKQLNNNLIRGHFYYLAGTVSYSTLKKVYDILSLYFNYLDGNNKMNHYREMLTQDCLPREYLTNKETFVQKGRTEFPSYKKQKGRIITKNILKEHAEKTVCALVGDDYEKFVEICSRKYENNGKFIEGESGLLWGPLAIILAETGMRYSEIAALDWRDVNFEEKKLVIRKGYHVLYDIPEDFSAGMKTKRNSYLSTTKTKSSRRVINLSSLAIKHLEEYYKNRKSDTDFCFLTSTGKVVSNNQLRQTIMKVLYEMKLYIDYDEVDKSKDNTIGPHMLRHSYATRRLVDGASPLVIASEMGHENTEMVEEIYVNLSSDIIQMTKK